MFVRYRSRLRIGKSGITQPFDYQQNSFKIVAVFLGGLVFFYYLCSMNKDEIILMLQQLVTSLLQQLDEALRQLGEANSKADALLLKIEELENLLVLKNAEEQKQRNVIKGLTKIQQNKSEKQAPSAASGT